MRVEVLIPKARTGYGFTLLELMISMTIVSLIVLIIFGAFRIGIRAWEKGERDIESQQRLRTVLGLVKRQLSSACLLRNKPEDFEGSLLKGDSKSLRIASRIALLPVNKYGMVYAYYNVKSKTGDEKEGLDLYEKNIVFFSDWKDIDNPDEEDFVELISGFHNISFEYLMVGDDEDDQEWKDSWDSEADGGLPRAIRIILTEGTEMAPLYLIAGIENESSG
ncbi:MAG TPA: prepilin-type N-terminal cleavage/methylation domain-containing protein [Desulfobacteraceae bacterium]|jgi:general secretion pathway protein J|nr:prepilin-type N-terminal cleavage/methylation domain-containing protein [Desulfobacteraceae bacterium]HPJ67735.1 prepilin-type N-terminal cleavage/methylation domain-containing protein [Desulfobacteraceae bacterium]HPQ28115.1 prepilin-type N-terminal cleavage/methylation domain-containing protein [Desulfobacteraceae bacterium]